MENNEQDFIVFEDDDGTAMEFSIVHEFLYDGCKYAVLRSTSNAEDTLIAEISDPLGPEEEFIPLPLKKQQDLLEFLKMGAPEID